MIDIIGILVGFFRAVFGFLFLLFIPGFAISFALYPRLPDISILTRFALSFVVSIGAVMASVLFLDLVLGIDTTPFSSFLVALVISVAATVIWGIELFVLSRRC
jgi:uncharacterized membrane protein